eukprot:gene9996-8119_t
MCMWFTDNTAIPKGTEPTIARDSPLRTFYDLVTPCTTTPCTGKGED